MIRLCILGPSGRMGRLLVELIDEAQVAGVSAGEDSPYQILSAVDHPSHAIIGTEIAKGVSVTTDLATAMAGVDAYVDFTTPEGTRLAAEAALERGTAGVIGTTGLDEAAEKAIDELAERAPVVVAPNFSLGVNVLLGLARRAARALGPGFDSEIVEIHHRHKRDAPSGTALALAEAIAAGAAKGSERSLRNRLSREGDVGARPDDELGVLAVRGGDVAGEHTAHFLGQGERLELTHRAGSRRIFAQGALHAAKWVIDKSPGRYDMGDVLEL